MKYIARASLLVACSWLLVSVVGTMHSFIMPIIYCWFISYNHHNQPSTIHTLRWEFAGEARQCVCVFVCSFAWSCDDYIAINRSYIYIRLLIKGWHATMQLIITLSDSVPLSICISVCGSGSGSNDTICSCSSNGNANDTNTSHTFIHSILGYGLVGCNGIQSNSIQKQRNRTEQNNKPNRRLTEWKDANL